MKPFKQTCLFVADELVQEGVLPEGVITKSIIENASGIKMWHALRTLSDLLVQRRISSMESVGKCAI